MASYLDFESLKEEKLTAKDRREVDDTDFGIPSQRRYPMPDKNHLMQAFNLQY